MKNYRSGLPFHLLCKAIFLLIICGLIYRCGSALYVPTIEDQERTGIMLDSLKEGRKIYTANCGSCHNLYIPEQYNSAEWERNVAKMQEKGKITDGQKVKVLYYLKSSCKK
jgi:hypothetical protein